MPQTTSLTPGRKRKVTPPEVQQLVARMFRGGATQAAIRRKTGISARQLGHILRAAGLWDKRPRRRAVASPEVRAKAIELVHQGVATKDVAAKLGLGRGTVHNIFAKKFGPKERGIEFESVRKYRCEPCSERNNNATFTNVRPCVACECEKVKQGENQ